RVYGERKTRGARLVARVVQGDVARAAQVEEFGMRMRCVDELVVCEGVLTRRFARVAAELAERLIVGGNIMMNGIVLSLVELDRCSIGAEIVRAPGVIS